jgi:hypothetical protein
MNKNKGFISLILAIVIGVVVVGGGAYYLGKVSKVENKEVLENNNDPISSEIRTSGAGGLDGNMKTNPNSSITIISPNGGETYNAGEKMIIKWSTKDISPSLGVWFHLDTIDGKHLDNGDLVSSWTEVLNTGETTLTIPAHIPTGKYKLGVTIAMEIEDVSDNSFTINSEIKNNNAKEYGDDFNGKHIGFIKSIDSKNNLSIDYVQWVSPCVANPSTSYCMNGFDVINDNTKLRSFSVLDTAQIKLQTYSNDSSGNFNWNQVVSLPVFKKALNSDLLYWVTLKDGKIVEITEQYRP